METKRKKHHRVYRRVPEEMRLEIAKDYYLGQMPQVENVRKYELCETTVREILRKFAAENNKSALLMKNKTTDSLSEENKALRKEVMELKKKLYDEVLKDCHIIPSMTEDGNPKDNAMAERINSTVKNELLHGQTFTSIKQVADAVRKAVKFYNEERPHSSIDMLTPNQAHQTEGKLKKHWHSYRDDAIEELLKAAV